MSVCSLGNVLQAAGVVRGMALDINPGWIRGTYYTHDGGRRSHTNCPIRCSRRPTGSFRLDPGLLRLLRASMSGPVPDSSQAATRTAQGKVAATVDVASRTLTPAGYAFGSWPVAPESGRPRLVRPGGNRQGRRSQSDSLTECLREVVRVPRPHERAELRCCWAHLRGGWDRLSRWPVSGGGGVEPAPGIPKGDRGIFLASGVPTTVLRAAVILGLAHVPSGRFARTPRGSRSPRSPTTCCAASPRSPATGWNAGTVNRTV